MTVVRISDDALALACGADAVAAAFAAAGCTVERVSSWGMHWLEPLVEVVTPLGRIAYGPVTAADVPDLLDAGLSEGGDHPLRLGPATDLPWMLYNNPVAYRTDFLPEQIAELAAAHENLQAVKESSTDVRRITALKVRLGKRLALLVGVDDLVVEGVRAAEVRRDRRRGSPARSRRPV